MGGVATHQGGRPLRHTSGTSPPPCCCCCRARGLQTVLLHWDGFQAFVKRGWELRESER